MKTFTQRNLPEETVTPGALIFIVLLMGILQAPLARAADANDGFQYNALFNPGPAQLKAETRGRVTRWLNAPLMNSSIASST